MSKIRFAKISSFPGVHYSDLYKRDPSLAESSYEKQYRALMNDCYAFSDFWKTELEKTGKFEAQEILINVEPLQKKWAKENSVAYTETGWTEEILCAQISSFHPDVVFAHSLAYIDPKIKTLLKKQNPSIKLMIGWDGIASHDLNKFGDCDIILSCDQETADFYSNNGFDGYFFTFGFGQNILDKIKKRKKRYDVSFVGSVVMKNDFHSNRLHFLTEIAKNKKLHTWIPNFPSLSHPFDKTWLWRMKTMSFAQYLDLLRLSVHNENGAYGMEMYQVLADSKITLNMHATKNTGNMRLFEATGVGTCLLTDDTEKIEEYFVPDKEIVVYKNIPDALEKIGFLLKNEDARKKIAEAGQKRTLEQYSFQKRMSEFSDFIESKL